MPAIFEYTHTVDASEIDAMGHVNNLRYIAWMQAAAIAHSSAQGWTPERYEEDGSAWVVRSHFIEYLHPTFEGETIIVRTWVSGMKKISSTREYQIRQADGDVMLARANTNWAFIGREAHVPRRIPPEVGDAFVIVDCSSNDDVSAWRE